MEGYHVTYALHRCIRLRQMLPRHLKFALPEIKMRSSQQTIPYFVLFPVGLPPLIVQGNTCPYLLNFRRTFFPKGRASVLQAGKFTPGAYLRGQNEARPQPRRTASSIRNRGLSRASGPPEPWKNNEKKNLQSRQAALKTGPINFAFFPEGRTAREAAFLMRFAVVAFPAATP